MTLGRSGASITILKTTVTKTYSDPWELAFIRQHPDIFIKILDHGGEDKVLGKWYRMPRLTPTSRIEHILEASELLAQLWVKPALVWMGETDWHSRLLAHLSRVLSHDGFELRHIHGVLSTLDRLPSPRASSYIHGDPTLANVLQNTRRGRRWHWIDPLSRPYIPQDRHVDLGKMYQSCYGYEQALQDKPFDPQYRLMKRLAAKYDLDFSLGLRWCLIHWARLIPYQQPTALPRLFALMDIILRDVKAN